MREMIEGVALHAGPDVGRRLALHEVIGAALAVAKEHHPDLKQGDKEAEKRFREIQAAYDVLKSAEERKTGKAV